jgi:hypothetical protein
LLIHPQRGPVGVGVRQQDEAVQRLVGLGIRRIVVRQHDLEKPVRPPQRIGTGGSSCAEVVEGHRGLASSP